MTGKLSRARSENPMEFAADSRPPIFAPNRWATPEPPSPQPSGIVLQFRGVLDATTATDARQQIEQALHCATHAVIVDLLWVSAVTQEGFEALREGIERSLVLKKSLSFESAGSALQQQLDGAWTEQRSQTFGPWEHSLDQGFESFLQDCPHTKVHTSKADYTVGSLEPWSHRPCKSTSA